MNKLKKWAAALDSKIQQGIEDFGAWVMALPGRAWAKAKEILAKLKLTD